jgi:hypothetical protein
MISADIHFPQGCGGERSILLLHHGPPSNLTRYLELNFFHV